MTKTTMKMMKKAPNHIPVMETLIQPMIAMMTMKMKMTMTKRKR